MAAIMNAKDAVNGALGECYVTVDGRRYNFMSVKKINADFEKNKEELPILGKTGKGNKATGWKGTGSMTMYDNTPVFRKCLEKYKNTGEDFYFDIQITNEDPGSEAGRQTCVLKDCNIDSATLAQLDADSAYLETDLDFTFEDFEFPETYTELTGM